MATALTTFDAIAGFSVLGGAAVFLAISFLRAPDARHARVSREGGTVFLGERLMHLGYTWINPIARHCSRLGLSADMISWSSLVFGAASGLLAAVELPGFAAWALVVGGVCDGLDGAVARLRNTTSRGGAVLDSAIDRYVEFFLFAGLLYFFRAEVAAQLLILTALLGSFMVTYSTAKAEALQTRPPRGWMKRAERLVWLTGGLVIAAIVPLAGFSPAVPLLATCAAIAVFANLSAIIRLRALIRAVRD